MLSFEQKCNNFTAILKDAAERQSCVFFDESGEGNDMETDTLFCEDVAGWLIPTNLKDEFISSNRKDDKWDTFFVFAEWCKEGDDIKIVFKKYPNYAEGIIDIMVKID